MQQPSSHSIHTAAFNSCSCTPNKKTTCLYDISENPGMGWGPNVTKSLEYCNHYRTASNAQRRAHATPRHLDSVILTSAAQPPWRRACRSALESPVSACGHRYPGTAEVSVRSRPYAYFLLLQLRTVLPMGHLDNGQVKPHMLQFFVSAAPSDACQGSSVAFSSHGVLGELSSATDVRCEMGAVLDVHLVLFALSSNRCLPRIWSSATSDRSEMGAVLERVHLEPGHLQVVRSERRAW